MSGAALMTLVRTIVTADDTVAFRLLAASPALAKARFEIGATRQTAETYHIRDPMFARGIAVVLSPFTTRSMACRAHADGTHPHKRRPLPVSSKQAPIQTPPIKAE